MKDESESSVYLKESAAFALGMIGDAKAVDTLVNVLETGRALMDKFTFLKERAIEALSRINTSSDKVFHALEKSLKDQSVQVRINAIEALSNLCISMGLFDEAMLYCSAGFEVNDFNAHFWNIAGVIHFQIEEYAEAAEFFEHAVSISPHYYDVLANLKDTYEELGNIAGMEECNKKLESLKGNN